MVMSAICLNRARTHILTACHRLRRARIAELWVIMREYRVVDCAAACRMGLPSTGVGGASARPGAPVERRVATEQTGGSRDDAYRPSISPGTVASMEKQGISPLSSYRPASSVAPCSIG